MLYLPTAVGAAVPWTLYDFLQRQLKSDPADADGVITLELPQIAQDELWLIDRLVVQCDSVAATEARLYVDLVEPTRILDGTRSGNFDVADEAAPIQLPGASTLICQWTGADPGSVAHLRLQATVMKRTTV